MIFVETPVFTKLVKEILSDDEYRHLQEVLLTKPDTGVLIPGGAGLRKMRWGAGGKGKRGGLRVIYYWDVPQETFYMLTLYRKSVKQDMTSGQIKLLRELVKEWLL